MFALVTTRLSWEAGIAGSVTIEQNCVIGGQVGIADHVHLCEGVTVASKSGVTKDISQARNICRISC